MVPSVMLSPISGTGTMVSVFDAKARTLPNRRVGTGTADRAGRCEQFVTQEVQQ